MKATFQIPDELYREVKAETAREGRTVREVAIGLFEEWLRKKRRPALSPAVDWMQFQPPLAQLVQTGEICHDLDSMRNNVSRNWDEQP